MCEPVAVACDLSNREDVVSGIYPSAVDTPMLRHAAGLFEWMGQRGFKKYLATTAAAPS